MKFEWIVHSTKSSDLLYPQCFVFDYRCLIKCRWRYCHCIAVLFRPLSNKCDGEYVFGLYSRSFLISRCSTTKPRTEPLSPKFVSRAGHWGKFWLRLQLPCKRATPPPPIVDTIDIFRHHEIFHEHKGRQESRPTMTASLAFECMILVDTLQYVVVSRSEKHRGF